MSFNVIIPVRFDSTRLPGKALVDIHGKPMIQHVYERALQSGAEHVVIATDDERIEEAALGFHAEVCMTHSDHETGTERLAEAVVALGWEDDDIVVNVQGDEPMISPKLIAQVAHDLEKHDNVKVTTACAELAYMRDVFNPDLVKVVFNRRGYAMYFSRAPIGWEQGVFDYGQLDSDAQLTTKHYGHIGVYAYRAGFLQTFLEWEGCPEESQEKLEQLRILWYGGKIHVAITEEKRSIGVDTPEDLEQVRALMKS
jgi:3-deoxy-manno-octulosonate cytidylyltransferase (CMP-KDO synthetase)